MAEWPKAPLSKSGRALKVLVGSNPTLSANEIRSRRSLQGGPLTPVLAYFVRPAIGSRSVKGRRFAPLTLLRADLQGDALLSGCIWAIFRGGEMSEWPKEHVWKACRRS